MCMCAGWRRCWCLQSTMSTITIQWNFYFWDIGYALQSHCSDRLSMSSLLFSREQNLARKSGAFLAVNKRIVVLQPRPRRREVWCVEKQQEALEMSEERVWKRSCYAAPTLQLQLPFELILCRALAAHTTRALRCSWQWQCNNNSSSKVILCAKIFGSINIKEVNWLWQSSVEHSSFLWKFHRKISSSLKQARMRTLCWPFCIISYHCEIFHDMMNAQKITSPGQAGKGRGKSLKSLSSNRNICTASKDSL